MRLFPALFLHSTELPFPLKIPPTYLSSLRLVFACYPPPCFWLCSKGRGVLTSFFLFVCMEDGLEMQKSAHSKLTALVARLRCQLNLWLKGRNKSQSLVHLHRYSARGERYNQGPCYQLFTLSVNQSLKAYAHSWRHYWQVALDFSLTTGLQSEQLFPDHFFLPHQHHRPAFPCDHLLCCLFVL